MSKTFTSTKQQYKRVTNLNRHWKKSRREEEKLRGRREMKAQVLRANTSGAQQQQLPQPQVWPRRQKIPQQQILVGPALMEKVEKMNIAVVNLQ